MSNPLKFNVNDLTVMKSIIDCTTQRGAIKPNELKVVGELYEKITMMISENTANSQSVKIPPDVSEKGEQI